MKTFFYHLQLIISSYKFWIGDKLCGFEPESHQPQINYGENDTPFNISGKMFLLCDVTGRFVIRLFTFLLQAIEVVSAKNDKEIIELGLEVGEETYLDLHHNLTTVPDPLRLPGHKSVSASIAAAQAVLTNTLSPTTHRKKKPSINLNSSVVGEIASQTENIHYSFNKEIDQILALGIFFFCTEIHKFSHKFFP